MKSETVKEKSKNFKDLLPWLFFIALAGGWVLFYLLRVEHLLDADMSSEMVLSEILAKEHGIITPNWKYSTEIRVLNNQIFFSLFLMITKSYRISRLLSGVVLLAVYGASFYYLCVQAGVKNYFPIAGALLFLPFSADYAYIILYGLYYIPHVAISFTTTALILHIAKTQKSTKKYVLAAVLMLLSIAAGLGGPRQIVICYLPLLLLCLWQSIEGGAFVWGGAVLSFIGGGIGFAVNKFVLSGRYHFNSWDNLNFTGFSFAKAETLIMGILHEYGYTEESVFSAALIKNGAALAVVAGLILYFVSLSRRKIKEKKESFVAGAAVMITAVYFLLYLCTDMYYEDRYALPVIVFAAPIAAFALKNAFEDKKKIQLFSTAVIPAAVCAAVVIAGLGRIPGLWRTDLTGALKQVSDSLVAQGYQSGYASYWNGNIMTELSEGRFEMFNWDDYVEGKVDVEELYVWLQPVSHYDKKAEGKVFILLSTAEETQCPLVEYLTEEDVAARNDAYVAYGFENREAMLYALSDHTYDLNDTDGLNGGESIDGSWVLHNGSSTSGPNMTFYAGSYELRLTGKGLDRLDVSATEDFGAEGLEISCVSQADDEKIYSITVPVNTYHVEFNMQNLTDDDIRIDSAVIERSGGV